MPTPDPDAALRHQLVTTIFRGRGHIHPPALPAARPADTPRDAAADAVHKAICAAHPDVAWERATLQLDDVWEPGQTRLEVLLGKAAGSRGALPVVCLLHQTSRSATYAPFLAKLAALARRGFLAVSLDARHHGSRAAGPGDGKAAYLRALVRAWRAGADGGALAFPFIYDTAADLFSVADYLAGRADVDVDRLGIAGVSLGGMHAWFAAAADTRWRAVAPLIGMQSFGYALEKGCFHARVESIRDVFEAARDDMGRSEVCGEVVRAVWDKICPGLVEKFDCAQSLRLLKHRPVFIGNGELDARCPTEPVREAVEKVRGEEGGENMVLRVYEGVGHEVTEEMWGDCVAFFEKWFGKEGVAGVDGAVEEVRCPVAGVDVC